MAAPLRVAVGGSPYAAGRKPIGRGEAVWPDCWRSLRTVGVRATGTNRDLLAVPSSNRSGMKRQVWSTRRAASHPTRTSDLNRTVSGVGFVLIGLALIASAFSNLPVQVSGLVNVRLSRPRRAPGPDRVRSRRLGFVAARPARLFDPARHATAARAWWKRRREPSSRPEPGVNIGVPPRPNRPSEVGSGS
jgi:hypothetical protein